MPLSCKLIVLAFLVAGCGGETAPPVPSPAPEAAPPPPGGPPGGPAAPSGGNKYEEGAVTDGGSVVGAITYAGDKKDTEVSPNKDMEVCENTDGKRPAGALLVVDGKLANAVVLLPDIAKGKKWDLPKTEINNTGCRFEPHISLGRPGGKVAARNSDPVLHNTNLTLKKKNKKIANIALPNKDQVIEKSLKKPGLVDVRCDAHEWMQAYVYVAKNPYAFVTGADGSFTFTDVPAGEHKVVVWHEVLGGVDGKVTVVAGAEAKLELAYN